MWCIDIKLIDKVEEESMTSSPVHDVFKCNLHHEHILKLLALNMLLLFKSASGCEFQIYRI